MSFISKKVSIVLAAVLISILMSGCAEQNGAGNAAQMTGNGFTESVFRYRTFSEIPGVTEEEIREITALKNGIDHFVYGMNPSTETFYNEDGGIGGYSVLFCEWLGNLFGIPFVPTVYDWDELINGLNSGNIDFTGELTANPERRQTYFMTDSIAERTVKNLRLLDSISLFEIAEVRPLRYAFLDGATTINDVRAQSDYNFESFFVNDYQEAYDLLMSGKVDAFIDEGSAEAAFDIYGNIIAKDFFPLVYSPVSFSAQKKELAPVVSVVQKALKAGGTRYLAMLYNEGLLEYSKHKLISMLKPEETAFLRYSTGVKMIAEFDNYPVSFYNTREKEWQGIAIDVIGEIEKLTGLSFEIVNTQKEDWPVLMKMLEDGEAMMISELIRSHDREGRFIWPRNSIMTDHYALLSKSDLRNLNVNEVLYARVGVSRGTAHTAVFRNWFSNHSYTIEYPNMEMAFRALEQDEVDVIMASQAQLLSFTNYYELPGYKANVIFERTFDSTFGFNKNEVVLCSIIDKALGLIDRDIISGQWMRRTYDYRAKMVQARLPWLIGAAILCMIAIILLVIMVFRNRHEGKRLDGLVKKRTAELEAVIKNYKGVIWSVNSEKTITTFNGQYLKKLGIDPAFLEGKNLDAARQKNRHLDVIENVEKTFIEGSQDWISEIDNGIFHSITTPMYDSNGSIIGVVGSTDDVTDNIKLQQDLKIAVEAAQSASRAKSVFLANMSHEIRTPMNAIIGMTTIGKSAADSGRKDNCFLKIEDASRHLLGVINDILDMSKIEANKFELSPEDFEFEKMLQQVVNVINFRIDEKHLKFLINIDNAIPKIINSDSQRLAQVITNLLGNAVKFTPENGSVRVNAVLLGEEEGVCTIQIEVIDSGIGISMEQQDHLFQSFAQAEASTSRKFGGTGLGLVISKSIVEMMGGRIWIKSELNHGSTFAFTIKAKRGNTAKKTLLSPDVNWDNIRILAVDDDPDILSCFTAIIKGFKIGCDTASSAVEAVRLIEQNGPYDIYFIDWKMPGTDGMELTRLLKKKTAADRSVVVMVSSAEWNTIEKDAKESGVDKFLPKPLFPSSIADLINDSIGINQLKTAKAGSALPGAQDETPAGKDRNAAGKINGIFEGHCILLAEDVEINREIVLTLLEPTLLKIDCAVNGIDAVRLYSDTPDKYEMILMDIQMPEMDGYEATGKIRELESSTGKQIPIIAMTANVFREDIEKCLEAGMSDHIGKPLSLDDMLMKLRRYLLHDIHA